MKTPLTVWNYSLDTETERIIDTLGHIANRFFPKHGFLVLPYLVSGDPKTIYLPSIDLNQTMIQKFNCIGSNIPISVDPLIHKDIKSRLSEIDWCVEQSIIEGIKNTWEKVEDSFWMLIRQTFPWTGVEKVEIRPTQFGSICSFDYHEGKIYIYFRVDVNISHIAEAIISSLLQDKLNGQTGNEWQINNWEEKEATVDSYLTVGPFAELFPEYAGTISALRKEPVQKYQKNSKDYLSQMEINDDPIFTINGEEIFMLGKSILSVCNYSEQNILRCMIAKKGRLVSFDEIADTLWQEGDEEKYSLWAIAKIIQRLRDKIASMGIYPDIIQTKRKMGYVLVD